ncbi:MAG: LPP20 family lipoprotein [Flavobacteriales bacterium]|nr:LPP20 family lipoprotein [Flavobacteriales bacterium]
MKRLLPLIVLVAIVACKGRQRTPTGPVPVETTEAPRPEWVRSRPVSSAYYIGIGLASKARPDVMETAKKNALNDLASEISVTVEGNSLLYTLDRKTRFDESFTSTIRTRTSEQIEGFELMDTWENGTEYWTYYRLSRSEHARLKAERKQRAIANATDLFTRARTSIGGGDLRSAMDSDLRALIAMKSYWGENDVVEIDGKQVPLVNEVYGHLQQITSSVRIAVLPERCVLEYGNHFRREMLITATHVMDGRTRELPQLPLRIAYPGSTGPVKEMKSTDTEGRTRSTVQRVEFGKAGMEMIVEPDPAALVSSELDKDLVKLLLAGLTIPATRTPIDVRMPRVSMKSQENNLGQPVGDAGLSAVLREELTGRGFRFVEKDADADVMLTLNCSTRAGGESSGFYTTYLDVTYVFRDRKTQEVVHEGTRQGVKGVQLNFEKAGLDAYKKAAQDLRKDLVPAILDAMQ